MSPRQIQHSIEYSALGNGEIVVAQPHQLPLIVKIGASLLKLATGEIYTALDLLAFGSLFTCERALGFCVLIGAIAFKVLEYLQNI
jgi:hypothetical protein